MFSKILIANRGEIACRIIATCRRMGIATVAVFSDADRDARHVLLADEAVHIGPSPPRESYLDVERIIGACRATGAAAVHPGYGFLAENAEFVLRVAAAGITFIGPGPEAIAAMGDKIASKKLAMAAGVSTIPGHNEAITGVEDAVRIARETGYPVMIKASAGGGGKGLRVARNDDEARDGFSNCRAEALTSFGDDRVFIEKFIEEPRHIEIQVLGDAHGNVVHLFERECSIQRRHQKVIEEAPSPFLDEATREAMGRQAVALARAVHYQSAGTVEFVVGKDRGFYFLEMNTRLQVEHPVTEMITGLDLVELMIRVAAGEKLPVRQQDLHINGWAIECRINAEDPLHEFLPSVGRFVRYQEPETVAGRVRVDTGAYEGGEIPLEYDSLVAKLVCHGATRDEALARTRDALNAFVIRGVSSNIAFQAALTRHPRFVAGRLSTAFIAEEFPEGFHGPELPPEEHDLLVMVAAAVHRIYLERASRIEGQMPGHELRIGENFVVIGRDTEREVGIRRLADGCDVRLDGVTREIRSAWRFGDILMRGTCDGVAFCMQVERPGLKYRLSYMGVLSEFSVLPRRAAQLLRMMPRKLPPDMSQFLLSPMPGLLAEVLVESGQPVKAGERLVVIEAMKMRNTLHAERKGTVAELLARQGDVLAVGQPVLRFGSP